MASTKKTILQRLVPSEVTLEIKDPVNPKALEQARAILSELTGRDGRVDGERLLEVAGRLGDFAPGDCSGVGDLVVSAEDCKRAYESLGEEERASLTNMHARIRAFAELQRSSVTDTEMEIPGGRAGHTVSPCRGKRRIVQCDA